MGLMRPPLKVDSERRACHAREESQEASQISHAEEEALYRGIAVRRLPTAHGELSAMVPSTRNLRKSKYIYSRALRKRFCGGRGKQTGIRPRKAGAWFYLPRSSKTRARRT